ncbi:MAG TPA: hypothetical protein DD979_03735 [Gammaproteobacteria bacterium]|jgi:OOP family OmpA-OmpF porin|nr:hypothetical protein [Gammaproteobacteria bacterium]
MNRTHSTSENTRNRRRWWAVGGIGLTLILVIALIRAPSAIERNLATAVNDTLTQAGLEDVAVSAEAQHVHLSGRVTAEDAVPHALAAAGTVPGVRSLTHDLAVETPRLADTPEVPETPSPTLAQTSPVTPAIEPITPMVAPELLITRTAAGLTVSGQLANPDVLAPALADLRHSVDVDNQLIANPDVEDAGWLSALEPVLASLPVIEDARLNLADDTLSVVGYVESEHMLANVQQRLAAIDPAVLAVDSSLGIRAPEEVTDTSAPLEEPSLWMEREGDKLVLSGTVADQATVDTILDRLQAEFGTESIDNRLRVSQDVSDAVWLEKLLAWAPGLKKLEAARIGIEQGTLSIAGQASSSEYAREQDALANETFADLLEVKSDIVILEVEPVSQALRLKRDLADIDISGILFASNSADIDPTSIVTLDALAQTLQQYPEFPVIVAGHTDATGDEQWNQYLSQLRANAVRDYLISRNITKNRISAIGYGESRPIATNATRAGRAQNRRIEINY